MTTSQEIPNDLSPEQSLPVLPKRDRIAILIALAATTILAWAYLINMAIDMDAMTNMPMDGMGNKEAISAMGEMANGTTMGSMGSMNDTMALKTWTLGYFVSMLLMWVIMMIGMMVPTAVPMALIYAAIARKAAGQGHTLAPTAVFVNGYIVMWSLFSIGATVAQWGLDEAALLSPMMVSTSPMLGALLLVAAGIYQLTPAKHACLQHCRAPAHFISQRWKPGLKGAFYMGLEHGAFCLGCCWVLMALLFLGGVMNLLWICLITLFVLLEKVLPLGALSGRVAGGAMIFIGLVFGMMDWWG